MNTEDNSENTVEVLTGDDIMPLEPQKYDIIEYEGAPARFYPATGAIFVFSEEHNRWIIRANRGGRPGFDGAEMVKARELKKREAIINGLEEAAEDLDLRFTKGASGVLSAIVAARAKNAVEDDGRTGNADAKFIFSIISQDGEGDEIQPALRVDMDADTARDFIQKVKELMEKSNAAD